jgi:WD40 repeat protein
VRLWDVRVKGGSQLCFDGKSDAVRCVALNPFHPSTFASAYENGSIQLWDLKRNGRIRTIGGAHQGLILSVAWHPAERGVLARYVFLFVFVLSCFFFVPSGLGLTVVAFSFCYCQWRPRPLHQSVGLE